MRITTAILILALLPQIVLGQNQKVTVPGQVRALPGHLDNIVMFNSNSPEVVQSEGILLSTFPGQEKAFPNAHLNYPLKGRFDIFAHHISNQTSKPEVRTLYLGILLHNPGRKPLVVKILQAASYLSQPDAPFIALPSLTANDSGEVYAGPGDRVMNDILRGKRQAAFPEQIRLAPGKSAMLLNQPIPCAGLTPPLNGRSAMVRLDSNGSLYVASMAMYARTAPGEGAPCLSDWEKLLQTGQLVNPREKPAHEASLSAGIVYGRVAGLARGATWETTICDPVGVQAASKPDVLTIPDVGQSLGYPLSSVDEGTFGTGQIQSAPLVVRYPDTALKAHGNYGVEYDVTLPLMNSSPNARTVTVSIQTPVKTNQKTDGLVFLQSPPERVFFRATVRVSFPNDEGVVESHYIHLVERQGDPSLPLVRFKLMPKTKRSVRIDFLYPPDSTPPQALTVTTVD